jgi:diaminohydroxyphosphoribosylaminopyrimidine deaminase/5-amino-6-(5-phosphoribosylamino)uracil reductase
MPNNLAASFTADDAKWMALALSQARMGVLTVSPNPAVGCVIVREGRLLSVGHHEKAGEGHAEVQAWKAAGGEGSIQGATVYVTLEPCSHLGRTPACSSLLVREKVSRVVVAMLDPNPLVAGRGCEGLRHAGIQVDVGLMTAEAEALNLGFLKRMRSGWPYVYLKMAASLDGRTALANGESQWITGEAAREEGHRLRAQVDVIVTGIGSVLKDDSRLTVRLADLPEKWTSPARWLLDKDMRVPLTAQLLNTQFAQTCIFTSQAALEAQPVKVSQLKAMGVSCILLPLAEDGRLDLHALLDYAGGQSINQLLVEAGASLAGAFVRQGLVDEWHYFLAPDLLGNGAQPLVKMPELTCLNDKIRWRFSQVRAVGADLKLVLKKAE